MATAFVCEDALDRLQEKITGMASRSGVDLKGVEGWGLTGDKADIPVLRFRDAGKRTIFKRSLAGSPDSELARWFQSRPPLLLLRQSSKHRLV